MNKVSIIINGVGYDAVEDHTSLCTECDLREYLDRRYCLCLSLKMENIIFKKSDKKFEL